MELSQKKIIVLGGSGFIGWHVCQHLASLNAIVTSFDRQPAMSIDKPVQSIIGDFFSEDDLLQAIRGQDCIIHSISSINPSTSVSNYIQGYEQDFLQTMRMCNSAYKNGQRVLFISSGGTVYAPQRRALKEDDPTCPINHYGSLKLCIENMMQAFIAAGADFRIVRVANAYGPGQDYKKGVGFIDAAIKHAINNETVQIWGDGNVVRDYIHVYDVARMICNVLSYEGNEVLFNIGTGIGTSQNTIIEMLKVFFPDLQVAYAQERLIDAKQIVLDINKYKRFFNEKLISITEGIAEQINTINNTFENKNK